MFCSKCGTQLADDAAFCPKCGTQVATPLGSAPSVVQPLSNTLLNSQNQFDDLLSKTVAPTPKKKTRRTGIIIAVAAVIVCAVGVLAFGFFQGWFGANAVYVPSKVTTYQYSQQGETIYNRDNNGNLLQMQTTVQGSMSGTAEASYSFDNNGYVTSFNFSSYSTTGDGADNTEAAQVTFDNEVDNNGRLSASTMHIPGLASLTATYHYFGESENVESIDYSNYVSDSNNDGSGSVVSYVSFLSSYIPDSFDPTQGALVLFSTGTNTLKVRYSEDGIEQGIVANGKEMNNEWGENLDELRGRTIESGRDSEESWQINSLTFDENGYLTDRVMTAKENAEDIMPGADPDYRYERHITYEQITHPSKAVSIFGRLHS